MMIPDMMLPSPICDKCNQPMQRSPQLDKINKGKQVWICEADSRKVLRTQIVTKGI